jgi:hypothetical protein
MRYAFAALIGALCLATPAESRVFVGIDVPLYYPLPIYRYPPSVYYPPPVYYGPEVTAPPPLGYYARGGQCDAGRYVCPLDRPSLVGSNCYCIGNDRRRAWGRVN